MKEVNLFEIPIYSMSEEEFYRRWDKFFEKNKSQFRDESTFLSHKELYFPVNVWKYNQIIGYITVSASRSDIWFNLYKAQNNKLYFNSRMKKFIIDTGLQGYHFRVKDNDSNKTIKNNIVEWLNELVKRKELKKYYIDTLTFKNQIEFMDIKEIINTIK